MIFMKSIRTTGLALALALLAVVWHKSSRESVDGGLLKATGNVVGCRSEAVHTHCHVNEGFSLPIGDGLVVTVLDDLV